MADASDSLRVLPAIVDSVAQAAVVTKTVAVPATDLLVVTMMSHDAHLSLEDPNEQIINAGNVDEEAGTTFFASPAGDVESFQVLNPVAGTWTLRVDATASGAPQFYALIPSYASDLTPLLDPALRAVSFGDSILIRGQVREGNSLHTDVTWQCWVIDPDGTRSTVTLADDGIHGDSLANDGIYGVRIGPSTQPGKCEVLGTAQIAGGAQLVCGGFTDVVQYQDLSVTTGDIRLSRNVVNAGDSVSVIATIHNNGAVAAADIAVDFQDLFTGVPLGSTTVTIPEAGSATAEVPWVVTQPDSHRIQVSASPFTLHELNLANNTAARLIVLGETVSVRSELPHGVFGFAPPRPNPTRGGSSFSLQIARASSARLTILDVGGRRVREWQWALLTPGTHELRWDGCRADGTQCPPGVYLCRLDCGEARLERKLIMLR